MSRSLSKSPNNHRNTDDTMGDDMRTLHQWADAAETAGTPEHLHLDGMMRQLPDAGDPIFGKLPGDEMLAKSDDSMSDGLLGEDMFGRLPNIGRSRARDMGPDSFDW